MEKNNKRIRKSSLVLLFPIVITMIQAVFWGVASYNGKGRLFLQAAVPLWFILLLLYGLACFFTGNARNRRFSLSAVLIVIFTGILMTFGALNQVLMIGHLTAEMNASKYILFEVFQLSNGAETANILHGAEEGPGTIDQFLDQEKAAVLVEALKAEGVTFTHTVKLDADNENLLPGETADDSGKVTRTETVEYNFQISAEDARSSRLYLTQSDRFPQYQTILEAETWNRELAEAKGLAANYRNALIAGIIFSLLLLWMHGHWFEYWIVPLSLAQTILFPFMRLFGSGEDGAYINFGPFQPLEFSKIIYLFVLTALLCKPEKRESPIRIGPFEIHRIVYALGYIIVNAAGFMLCGEMGTLLVMGCVGICMLMIFCEKKLFRLGILAAAAAGSFLIFLISHFQITYLGQKLYNRFHYFLNPYDAAQTYGYHYIQVRESLALSGWFGAETKFRFHISQEETDMAFSSLVQSQGVFYGIIVIVMLMGLLMVAYRAACRAEDVYYRGMGIGFCILLSFQGIIHIAYNVGIFPITGVPLMYISSGGSNLAVSIMVTIVLLVISSNHLHRALTDEEKTENLEKKWVDPDNTLKRIIYPVLNASRKFLFVLKNSFSLSWIRG